MAQNRVAQIAGHLFLKGMLAGQVAIITGSGQGIGAEAAQLFAKEGAWVVVQDIDASKTISNGTTMIIRTVWTDSCVRAAKAEAVAKSINDAGGKAVAVPGDMLNSAYISELVKKAADFGGGKIHIIVNNAGFTWDGVIHKVDTASYS